MSYDLFIWAGPPAANADEAFDLIEDASEGEGASLTSSPTMARFLADQFAEYPPLESDAGASDRDSPWSFTGDTSDRHASLSLSMPTGEQAFKRIVSLSRKHHLNCFDPESGDLYNRA